MYNYVYTMYNIKGGQQMSKKKLVAYRFPEELIELIKDTAKIMDRSEADTVRILLFRSTRYWITKKEVGPEQEAKRVDPNEPTEEEIQAMKDKMKKYR